MILIFLNIIQVDEMVIFLILIMIMLAYLLFSFKIYSCYINPVSIIMSFFIVWLVLGQTGYLGQYIPDVFSSVFLELNFITIGTFVFIGSSITEIHLKKSNFFNSSIKNRLLQAIRLISFTISLLILVNEIKLILTGQLVITQVRNISYSVAFDSDQYKVIYYNSFFYYVYQYLIRGFAFFDITYSTCAFFFSKRKYNFFTIGNFFMFVVIMQSRIEIMKITIFLLIVILISGIKLSDSQKRYIKKWLPIALLPIIFILFIRTGDGKNFLLHSIDSLIIDYSGSNYMFSKYFNDYAAGLRLSSTTFFYELFGGFSTIVEYFKQLLHLPINDISAVNAYLGKATNIGSSNHYNCFYTAYFGFLNSSGYIGCYLFSGILGINLGMAYRKYSSRKSVKRIYFLALFIYITIMITYNYMISGISSTILFLGVILMNDEDNQEKRMYTK